jgi:hypothetical protein
MLLECTRLLSAKVKPETVPAWPLDCVLTGVASCAVKICRIESLVFVMIVMISSSGIKSDRYMSLKRV